MSHPSLRCVVLDNDETTGAYRLVVACLLGFQKIKNLSLETFLTRIEALAECMMRFHLFRPGLDILLKTLIQLRNLGHIDAVVMYTNQKESIPERASLPMLYSPPQVIAYMMSYIMDSPVFDKIIARTTDKVYPKTFAHILKCFPEFPRDIRGITFVDDNATPSYILADSIPLANQSPSCWYRVKPYYKLLTAEQIVECLDVCFHSLPVSLELQESIMTYYYANEMETNDTNEDDDLIRLAEDLIRMY